jgi:signal peptidase I
MTMRARRRWAVSIAGVATLAVVVFLGIGFFRRYGFHEVPFRGMEPTILKGGLIMVDRQRSTGNVKLGDLLVFESPHQGEQYVQRVVGLPGDRIEVKSKTLLRNGIASGEPYVQHVRYPGTPLGPMATRLANMPVIEVPPGHVFLLGDNRDHVLDSRWWGAIPIEKLQGKVVRIWPP